MKHLLAALGSVDIDQSGTVTFEELQGWFRM